MGETLYAQERAISFNRQGIRGVIISANNRIESPLLMSGSSLPCSFAVSVESMVFDIAV